MISAVAAAKRHTVVLTSEGGVYTWGHRVVTPKRVVLAGRSSLTTSHRRATWSANGRVLTEGFSHPATTILGWALNSSGI